MLPALSSLPQVQHGVHATVIQYKMSNVGMAYQEVCKQGRDDIIQVNVSYLHLNDIIPTLFWITMQSPIHESFSH